MDRDTSIQEPTHSPRDTAGQERFYTFTKQFFRGTQVSDIRPK